MRLEIWLLLLLDCVFVDDDYCGGVWCLLIFLRWGGEDEDEECP